MVYFPTSPKQCLNVVPSGECYCYYNTLLCCNYFSSWSVVSCAIFALCTYSTFRHHPHPLGYFVPNSVSFMASIAELAHGDKMHTQSLSQLIWCHGNRSTCASEYSVIFFTFWIFTKMYIFIYTIINISTYLCMLDLFIAIIGDHFNSSCTVYYLAFLHP